MLPVIQPTCLFPKSKIYQQPGPAAAFSQSKSQVSWDITVVIDAYDNADDRWTAWLDITFMVESFIMDIFRHIFKADGLLSVSGLHCHHLRESVADRYIGLLGLRGIIAAQIAVGA